MTLIRHNDPGSPGLEPRLANHRSQAVRTAMLPIAPPTLRYMNPLLTLTLTDPLQTLRHNPVTMSVGYDIDID